jgi:hypothetical protein
VPLLDADDWRLRYPRRAAPTIPPNMGHTLM